MDMQANTSISGTSEPAPPRQSGNARERMFEEYQPLARKLARRYAQTSIPLEDLQQVAYVGLLLAIDRFDPGVGREFPSFAIPTILGEVRRHLRDHSRPVHVTRAAKERSAAVRRAREQLMRERGRAPTAQQIAQFLEMDLEHVIDGLLADATYDTKAFDEPVGETAEGATLADLLGEDDPGYNSAEARVVVRSALEELGARDRRVLQMRFLEEMTQTCVADILGCSQMQISRIEAKALRIMREHAGIVESNLRHSQEGGSA
jgi:RNA polymerase sigma-B factor